MTRVWSWARLRQINFGVGPRGRRLPRRPQASADEPAGLSRAQSFVLDLVVAAIKDGRRYYLARSAIGPIGGSLKARAAVEPQQRRQVAVRASPGARSDNEQAKDSTGWLGQVVVPTVVALGLLVALVIGQRKT